MYYATGTITTRTSDKVRVRQSTDCGAEDYHRARERAEQIEAEIWSGSRRIGKGETLGDAIDLFMSRPQGVGNTEESVLRRLKRDLGHKQLPSLKTLHLMTCITSRGNKPGTVAREINVVRACLSHARDMGVDIPEVTIKRPSVDDARERWLTKEERERFIAACPDASAIS